MRLLGQDGRVFLDERIRLFKLADGYRSELALGGCEGSEGGFVFGICVFVFLRGLYMSAAARCPSIIHLKLEHLSAPG